MKYIKLYLGLFVLFVSNIITCSHKQSQKSNTIRKYKSVVSLQDKQKLGMPLLDSEMHALHMYENKLARQRDSRREDSKAYAAWCNGEFLTPEQLAGVARHEKKLELLQQFFVANKKYKSNESQEKKRRKQSYDNCEISNYDIKIAKEIFSQHPTSSKPPFFYVRVGKWI
jgi:hypothetical protein